MRFICQMRLLIILFWGLFLVVDVFGQETLTSELTDLDFNMVIIKSVQKTNEDIDTIPDTLGLPFFDDFTITSGAYPDTLKWFRYKQVFISKDLAINAPSFGVATFDGVGIDGKAYSYEVPPQQFVYDSLQSHCIDLSGVTPSDSVYLSFYYQSGGNAEPPENNDSLGVYFKDTSNQFIMVQQFSGDSLYGRFLQVMIPITDSIYFRKDFQFQIKSIGSQYGAFDHWHIDYVYLDRNRRDSIRITKDRSIQSIKRGILGNYTIIPYKQFASMTNPMDTFAVYLSNLDTDSVSVNIDVSLAEVLNNQAISGGNQTRNLSFSGFGNRDINFGAFSAQRFDTFAKIQTTVVLNQQSPDTYPHNDIYYHYTRIDSLLGYDDGEAEVGYGLKSSRSFAQKYTLTATDSLRAVWISFVPHIETGPLKTFNLRVWGKDAKPENYLYDGYSRAVQYGPRIDEINIDTTPNCFIRFPLEIARDSILPLPTEFWIGIKQTDDKNIAVGFDRSLDNSLNIKWENEFGWQPSQLKGTLMIRPELSSGTTPFIGLSNNQTIDKQPIKIYPNPVTDKINIYYNENQPVIAEVIDIMGRVLISQNLSFQNDKSIAISHLPTGVYSLIVYNLSTKERIGNKTFIKLEEK